MDGRRTQRATIALCIALGYVARSPTFGDPPPVTAPATTIERTHFGPWAEAWRLSNGVVEVVIVPAIGRIVRYGFVGGDNVLWTNPRIRRDPATGRPTVDATWGWRNWGGDKAWPWPQADWPAHNGSGWPPPLAADQGPYTAPATADGGGVELTSPPVKGYGFRVVRTIRLNSSDANGAAMTVATRFDPIGDNRPAGPPAVPWDVAQVRPPDLLLAQLVPGSSLKDGYKLLSDQPWGPIRRIGPDHDVLALDVPPGRSAKLGIDADALAAVYPDVLLVLRAESPVPPASWPPGVRAQVCTQPDPAYVELEFVAAHGSLQPLTVRWELRRLKPGTLPDAAAQLLRDGR